MSSRIGRLARLAALFFAVASPALASAPAGRYTVSGGAVYDSMTKLTWQQMPPSTTHTWATAQTYCAGVSATLGGSGWRVPTLKELLTLCDPTYAVLGSAFDPNAFPSPQSTTYWSASRFAFTASKAWAVAFTDGNANTIPADQSTTYSVRCVR